MIKKNQNVNWAVVKEKNCMRWITLRGKNLSNASDAHFCFHEFKETGNLDLARCLIKGE